MLKYFVIRNVKGTCSSVGMLKEYMVRGRLGTSGLGHWCVSRFILRCHEISFILQTN